MAIIFIFAENFSYFKSIFLLKFDFNIYYYIFIYNKTCKNLLAEIYRQIFLQFFYNKLINLKINSFTLIKTLFIYLSLLKLKANGFNLTKIL